MSNFVAFIPNTLMWQLSTVPNVLVFFAVLAQISEERFDLELPLISKTLRKLQHLIYLDGSKNGLKYMNITKKEVYVVVCITTSFAENEKESSKTGILSIVSHRDDGVENTLRYASSNCKRACKSTLVAERFAFIYVFDIRFTITDAPGEMFGRQFDISMYTDSRSLYGHVSH